MGLFLSAHQSCGRQSRRSGCDSLGWGCSSAHTSPAGGSPGGQDVTVGVGLFLSAHQSCGRQSRRSGCDSPGWGCSSAHTSPARNSSGGQCVTVGGGVVPQRTPVLRETVQAVRVLQSGVGLFLSAHQSCGRQSRRSGCDSPGWGCSSAHTSPAGDSPGGQGVTAGDGVVPQRTPVLRETVQAVRM